MAFRRQDIPKTTRKSKDDSSRRLYPRYARDRSLLPKIDLAIDYLDGMVGRKRGDLSQDVLLDLFGDPKLARCILSCLSDTYRYRTPEIAEVVGDDAALALAAWDLFDPADVRGHVYRAANSDLDGFVPDSIKAAFLDGIGANVGLQPGQLEDLIHLDAERNALLTRVGSRPKAEDIVARYNTTLTISVLRQASEVVLDLPGLDATTIETVCARHEVPWQSVADGMVRLAGRRNAVGAWSGFGARVARCAVQLISLAPQAPSGQATVHLNDRPLRFVLDAKVVATVRPKQRAVATLDDIIRSAVLVEEIGVHRRKASSGMNGWTVRRLPEPIVVEGGLVLPEVVFTRGQLAIGALPVPGDRARSSALTALEHVNRERPVIALGVAEELAGMPTLANPTAAALLDTLERIADGYEASPTPLGVVEEELTATGWIPSDRLAEVLGEDSNLAVRVDPLTSTGSAAFVPGFGLCRTDVLDDLLDFLPSGPVDIAAMRASVAARIGDTPGADALTLHLLARQKLIAAPRADTDEGLPADRAA